MSYKSLNNEVEDLVKSVSLADLIPAFFKHLMEEVGSSPYYMEILKDNLKQYNLIGGDDE